MDYRNHLPLPPMVIVLNPFLAASPCRASVKATLRQSCTLFDSHKAAVPSLISDASLAFWSTFWRGRRVWIGQGKCFSSVCTVESLRCHYTYFATTGILNNFWGKDYAVKPFGCGNWPRNQTCSCSLDFIAIQSLENTTGVCSSFEPYHIIDSKTVSLQSFILFRIRNKYFCPYV